MTTVRRGGALIGAAATAALLLTACGSSEDSTGASPAAEGALQISAAFYPLQFVADAVGGEHVSVTSLTAPGVEPHDLELSPAQVDAMSDADLVLYIGQFQAAVDEAIDATGVTAFDAATVVTLLPASEEEHAEGEDEHAEEEHDHGDSDPHFWLDPALLADYAVALGNELASIDPANAGDYQANAEALAAELDGLAGEFATGLAQCEREDIVTSHAAFGYIAAANNLHQHGITGIDPETEPSPARLAELQEVIAETGTTTVFSEALLNPEIAESLAAEAGVATAVLDPIESVADGDTYITVQQRNLAALKQALGCS